MNDIAVIIPLYNGAKWIRFTLESVLTQTCVPSEIIVVDNNSTDSSVEIVKNFPNIQLINNPIPGPNFTRQCGFQASHAKFIAYLDQDDIWHPEHLNCLYNLLEQNSNYPAAVASSLSFSSSKNLRFPQPVIKTFDYNPWQLFPTNHITTPSSLMIRRTALESIGGWPIKFDFCGDIYTWLKLSVHHPFLQNKAITIGYRRQNTSQSSVALTKNTQKSFNSFLSALEDAFNYYSTVNNQDNLYLKRRLSAISGMSDILANIIIFEPLRLAQAILIFEERLSEESNEFIGSMCGLLIWFLYNHLVSQPTLLIRILDCWPQEAARTRRAFRSKIASSRLLVKGFLSQPLNIQFWQLLLEFSDKIFKKLPLYHQ